MLEERKLTREHDRQGFRCGSEPLDDFLKRHARQNDKANISRTFVLVHPDEPEKILGYYSLASAQVEADDLSPEERKRLPRYPVGVIRMARLAVHEDHQGEGLGKLLIANAVERARAAGRQVGAYALIVDAKDDAAVTFYEKYGFVRFRDTPKSLYLRI